MISDNNIEIGSVLSGYKIEKEIGRGGMGVVYKAHEMTLNRKVALKVLSHRLCTDTEFVERFKREARIIAALNHPCIVQILSYGEAYGLYYFAMEFVTGRDLGLILKEKGRIPLDEALSIVSQVAGALADAGAKGVVHRDLKPSNIMVDDVGRVKVTDFGVAHFEGTESRLTQTGLFLGTPEYASPEQATGKTLDVRSDIYALGAVLYSMLSGRPPMTGPSPLAVVAKIATESVTPIRQINPELPKPVCALIDKMLARELSDRFQTPQEVMTAVDRCMRHLKGDSPPVKGVTSQTIAGIAPAAKRSRTAVWGAILGVALAVVLVVWLVEGSFFRERPRIKEEMPVPAAVGEKKDAGPSNSPVAEKPVESLPKDQTTIPVPATPAPVTPTEQSASVMPETVNRPAQEPVPEVPSRDAVARIPVTVEHPPAQKAPVQKKALPAIPKVPTVLLAISGDEDMAEQIQPYLESVLQGSGLPVTAAAEIPVLSRQMHSGGTPISWRSIKQLIPPGEAQILVLVKVRQTGSMDLHYYGRSQEMITASFTASAVDMENGVSVTTPATASIQYTSLNMAEKFQTAVTSAASDMGPSIKQYWRTKIQ
jgi:serine/threonine protein kinase